MIDFQVVIVGGGPIGLLLGNFLGEYKIPTLIIEKEVNPHQTSRAIGITPPSLEILSLLNIQNIFTDRGTLIKKANIYGNKNKLGTVEFNNLKSDFNYILAIPQEITENILEQNIKNYPSVSFLRGAEFKSCENIDDKVKIKYFDKLKNEEKMLSASFLIGCDGSKSDVRKFLGTKFLGYRYKETFYMCDFIDKTDFGGDAYLFFTKYGAVESFPLTKTTRRWIIQTKKFLENPEINFLTDEIKKRTNIDLDEDDAKWNSPFGVQKFMAKNYFSGNVILAGDAAHLMPPIGGQGMNTGFGDVEFLKEALFQIICNKKDKNQFLKKYEKYRQRAFISAEKRSWISMKIGTTKGNIFSHLRNIFIFIILHSFLKNKIIPTLYSMITIPYVRFSKVIKKEPTLKS